MNENIYPPAPASVDYVKLEPSRSFKKQVGIVVVNIGLFFLVYILLILLSIGLAVACVAGCFALISASPGVITIGLGLGMLGLGIAVFVFLVKFIFAETRVDNSMKVEVTKESQPQLFAFIEQLTKETKTPFPKKIFISADVNASVSYNSNFWSMFLPVRKNLEIGLGLVNSVNISEFKAVMAHEFGHFSQRSMKLGSFTYNVNRVIYNMLYNNNSYNNFLKGWSEISGYFALFASITAGIANGIRSILNEMYKIINKSYLALSREMEFHADAVAASVAGGNNLVSSLNRLEIASSSYNTTLEHANSWLKEKKYSSNLFPHQLAVIHAVAAEHGLPMQSGLPEVSSHFLESFSRTRINYKDQWASHPSLKERTLHLNNLQMNVEPLPAPAWIIFNDEKALQKQLTEIVYGDAKNTEGLTEKEQDYFNSWYETEKDSGKLPADYNGFYNGRIISTKDWDIDFLSNAHPVKNFEAIFTKENAQLQENLAYNTADLETVKNIQAGHLGLKSFDFDGNKVSVKDTDRIIAEIDQEIKANVEKQELLQKEAFTFFQQQNKDDRRLAEAYKNLAAAEVKHQAYTDLANNILKHIQPFYEGNVLVEYIQRTISQLKANEEQELKESIGELIREKYIDFNSKDGILDKIIAFKDKDLAYFYNDSFINEDLFELNEVLFGIDKALLDHRWDMYKKMLELQLQYYTPAA